MDPKRRAFIPAAGHDWLLPLYDPLQRILGAEGLQHELVEAADLGPGLRVLDIGCGTGSVTLLLARQHPECEIVGLDPDPKALERARRKAARTRGGRACWVGSCTATTSFPTPPSACSR